MQKNKYALIASLFMVVAGIVSVAGAAEIAYDSGGRRDPFTKTPVQAGAGTALVGISGHLEGIIYDPHKQSLAVFGGKTFKIGETMGDSMIKKIQKDRVVVVVNGEEKILRIREEEKNRPV